MRRTWDGVLLTAMGLLLFVAVAGQVWSRFSEQGPETAEAVLVDGMEIVETQGLILRQEVPVIAEIPGSFLPCVTSGQRVAAGDTVFRWESTADQSRAAENLQMKQLGQSASQLPQSQRRDQLHGAVQSLTAASGQTRRAAAEELTARMLGEGGVTQEAVGAARAEYAEAAAGSRPTIPAPAEGVFAPVYDGLEGGFDPEDPWRADSLPRSPMDKRHLGRIILGDTWCYRTTLNFTPEIGESFSAQLPGLSKAVTLTVAATQPEGSGCGVLFSCQEGLEETAALRQLSLRIEKKSVSGLEIPAESVYTVEEQIGVDCVEGETIRFKPVEILARYGGTVLVRLDQSSTRNLWPGDRVLLHPMGSTEQRGE